MLIIIKSIFCMFLNLKCMTNQNYLFTLHKIFSLAFCHTQNSNILQLKRVLEINKLKSSY